MDRFTGVIRSTAGPVQYGREGVGGLLNAVKIPPRLLGAQANFFIRRSFETNRLGNVGLSKLASFFLSFYHLCPLQFDHPKPQPRCPSTNHHAPGIIPDMADL